MSEQELRDGLKSAVADEPPMSFDVDELVGQAERLVRRRRALIAVGMGTAAVAIAAVAVPVALGIAGGPVELPPADTPTVQQPPPPASTVPQLRERGSQMQVYLRSRLQQLVPGAVQVDARPFGGEAEGEVSDGQKYLSGFVYFKLGDTRTGIEVHVQSPSASKDGVGRTGTNYAQPDGSEVQLESVTGNDANPEMLITSATHFRKDGSVTRVTTYNYDPSDASKMEKQVALTDTQLIALATDPQLRL